MTGQVKMILMKGENNSHDSESLIRNHDDQKKVKIKKCFEWNENKY